MCEYHVNIATCYTRVERAREGLHDAARYAYLLWKHSGKHRQGVVYELMRSSISQFKHSLRVCKKRKNTIIADTIAGNLCKKDDRAFWGDIKKMTNSKIKLPSMVGDAHGNEEEEEERLFGKINVHYA